MVRPLTIKRQRNVRAAHRAIPLAFILAAASAHPAFASIITFTDDFNRPNGPVGNGWSDTTGNVNGNLTINNGALTTPNPDGTAGIFLPIDYSGTVTASATITQMNGFGGLLGRYVSSFDFGTDGNLSNGYSVTFFRGDQTFADSSVILSHNGTTLASAPSSFQFGAQITPIVTLSPNGSISGSVIEGGSTFNFSFAPQSLVLSGSDFAIVQGFPDSRSTLITKPTIDNVTITTENLPLPPPPIPTNAPPLASFPTTQQLPTSFQSFVTSNQQSISNEVLLYLEPALQDLNVLKGPVGASASIVEKITTTYGLISALLEPTGTLQQKAFVLNDLAGTILPSLLPEQQSTAINTVTTAVGLARDLAAGNEVAFGLDVNAFLWGTLYVQSAKNFALDPPDTNFTSVFQPSIPIANISVSTGNLALDALINRANASALLASIYLNAAEVSFDRYAGALQAGDTTSALLQLEAITYYLRLFNNAAQDGATGLNALLQEIQQFKGNVLLDPSALTALEQNLSTNGFDPSVLSFLRQLGLSDADINALLAQLVSFQSPNDLSLSDSITGMSNELLIASNTSPPTQAVPEPESLWILLPTLGFLFVARSRFVSRNAPIQRLTRPQSAVAALAP